MKKIVLFAVFILLFSFNLKAQWYAGMTNPHVYKTITHPPQLNLHLKRVAIVPDGYATSKELVDYLTANFVNSGTTDVVDREHLYQILSEQNLSLTGRIDKEKAVKLGKLLGANALITVYVYTEEYKREMKREEYKSNNEIRIKYIARLDGYLKFSVKTTDLQTGKIFAAKIFTFEDYMQNVAYDKKPEFPDYHKLKDRLYQKAMDAISKLYFPWNETVSFVFYNNKKCGMKQAYAYMKSKNYKLALNKSLEVLDCLKTSGANSKYLSRGYYNVGVGYFFLGDYDKAREYFSKAYSTKDYSTYKKAIDKVNLVEQTEREYFYYLKNAENTETQSNYQEVGEQNNSQQTEKQSQSDEDIVEKLKKLKYLYEQGLITEEEYKAKKKEILSNL